MTRKILAAFLVVGILALGMLLMTSCDVPIYSPSNTRTAAPGTTVSTAGTPDTTTSAPGPTKAPATTGAATTPTTEPTADQTPEPSPTPTPEPTAAPTKTTAAVNKTPKPSTSKTPKPTAAPTVKSEDPTAAPVVTAAPTTAPTQAPTQAPTAEPVNLAVQPGEAPKLDTSGANDEYVMAACNESARIKIGIQKDGGTAAYYDVPSDGVYHKFPITEGAGNYTVSLFRNTSGSSYMYVVSQKVTVAVEDPYAKYMQSNSVVNWNSGMSCVQYAATLMAGKTTEKQKAEAVYQWIVSHVSYDHDKANSSLTGYVSNPETTYSTGKGICLDFAVLYASMLRGNGIHASVNFGYCEGVNGYHAWNQIYVDGGWYTVDISSDSQYRDMGVAYSMYKDRALFTTEKVY